MNEYTYTFINNQSSIDQTFKASIHVGTIYAKCKICFAKWERGIVGTRELGTYHKYVCLGHFCYSCSYVDAIDKEAIKSAKSFAKTVNVSFQEQTCVKSNS